jgi:hypothetical protein
MIWWAPILCHVHVSTMVVDVILHTLHSLQTPCASFQQTATYPQTTYVPNYLVGGVHASHTPVDSLHGT